MEGKVPAFCLANGQLSGDIMAQAFVKGLQKMFRFVRKYEPPFLAKVHTDGRVVMWLDSVEIQKVLENLLRAAQRRQLIHGR